MLSTVLSTAKVGLLTGGMGLFTFGVEGLGVEGFRGLGVEAYYFKL